MTDADFLHEILAQPDDDAPRLIYADWLDERSNPRGQFIRVQCELGKIVLGRASGTFITLRRGKGVYEHQPARRAVASISSRCTDVFLHEILPHPDDAPRLV